MKTTLISIVYVMLVSINSTNAQITEILFENFNSGFQVGWQRVDQDGLIPHASVAFVNKAWTVYENLDSTGTGDSVLIATSYYNPAGQASDWVILPPVTLAGFGNIMEWEVTSVDPSYPDGYQVLVNTTGPVTDSFDINNPLFYTDAELPDWTLRSISLDSFAGQTVYIAFRLKSNDMFLLMLDDIHVYSDSTLDVPAENHSLISPMRIFPNPAESVLHVKYDLTEPGEFILIDLQGRECLRYSLSTGVQTLSCSSLSRGYYVARLVTASGGVSQPVILR